MTKTPLAINSDNEAAYEALAKQVFAEVNHRFRTRIAEFRPEDAPILRRGGNRVADHVWNIVWPSGPRLWGHPYSTDVAGAYLYSYNDDTALIHVESPYMDIAPEKRHKLEYIARYQEEQTNNYITGE